MPEQQNTRLSQEFPTVSLIVVVKDEINYIDKCVKSLLNQTYPKDKVELIFVDGMSSDGTREYLKKKTKILSTENRRVKFLDNPKKILATGWNIAIENSQSEFVCRVDTHATLSNSYAEFGVLEFLKRENEKIGAVGGYLNHKGVGLIGKAIASFYASPFAVGDSPFRRAPKDSVFTDTAVFAVYKREIFDQVGVFSETLSRNQDLDLHSRMAASGYKFITHPKMPAEYYVRSTLVKLFKKAYNDGLWVIMSKVSFLRHKVPLFFVLYLLVVLFFGTLLRDSVPGYINQILVLPLVIYLVLGLVFAFKGGEGIVRLLLVPLFFLYHVSYGSGSLVGIIKQLKNR